MKNLIFFNYFNELYYVILIFIGLFFILMGLFIVYTKSSVHSILYLMIMFLYMTELALLLKMDFLALIFIIIYIGAVCVLMLFHIKLIKTFMIKSEANLYENNLFIPFFFVLFCLPLIQIVNIINFLSFNNNNNLLVNNLDFTNFKFIYTDFYKWIDYIDPIHTIQLIALLLYNIFFMNLIYGGFILFLAMIGSIIIVLNKKYKTKKLNKKKII